MIIPSIDPEVRRIADRIIQSGKKAFLVGCAVRDSFLKRPVIDYDIATDATPEECMMLFPFAIPTGIKHGTITIISRSRRYKIEITTLRKEADYSDGRHPDSVTFVDDITQDLSRRDFTINAMAIDLVRNIFIDPFDGKKDLKNKIIRAVGNPIERFQEDGLRTIRAIRFSAQLEFAIEPNTLAAITSCSSNLSRVSAERIRDEFSKIILTAKPSIGLRILSETGLIEEIIPELKDCKGIPQPNHCEKDVYEHLLSTLDAVIPDNLEEERLLTLHLAALLHDIGKPVCYRTENETVSFYRHEIESERIARQALMRLKYPNRVIDKVCHLVRYHMFDYEPNWTDAAIRRFIARVGFSTIPDLFALRLADTTATTGKPISWPALSEFKARIDRILEEKQALSLKDLAINGEDLAKIGIPRGKQMGEVLSELLDTVLEDPALNTKEKLLEIAKAKYFGRFD